VKAEVVTLECRGHLDAAVAGDAIEVVLVALIAAAHGSAKPQAGLDCAAANEVVALAGEGVGGRDLGWHNGQ